MKDCFRTIEDCFHKISNYKASMNIHGNVTGDLCLHLTREEPVSEPKFASLIKAGKAIGIYDSNFEQRLDRLRDVLVRPYACRSSVIDSLTFA